MDAYTTWRGLNPWWIYSLLLISIVIFLQILTSSLSRRQRWIVGEDSVNLLPGVELVGEELGETSLGHPPLDASIRRGLEIRERWRRWTVHLYLSQILLCALSGLLCLLLSRPAYYPLVVALLPFVSAYFLARTWRGETRRPAPRSRPLGLSPLLYMA